jgi:hypothetical protein
MEEKIRKVLILAMGFSACYLSFNNIDDLYYYKLNKNFKEPINLIT